jgi:hypothetical protein
MSAQVSGLSPRGTPGSGEAAAGGVTIAKFVGDFVDGQTQAIGP